MLKTATFIPATLLSTAMLSHAVVTRVADVDSQNRFSSGYPGTAMNPPTANTSPDFLLAGFNLSGLGWDAGNPGRSFALVTPQHFIGATHFAISNSGSLNFRGSGSLLNYGAASTQVILNSDNTPSDLFLGTLDTAVDLSQITPFRVADLGAETLYVGQEIFVYGQTAKFGTGTISAFQDFGSDPVTAGSTLNDSRTYNFSYTTPNPAGSGDDAYFEGGDSGSPSFIINNGQLAITGTHSALVSSSFGGTQTFVNYDTFTPEYFDRLNAALEDGGQGFQLN